VLSITSSVSIRTFALPSLWRAWKCGGPWSSKNIAITIPKKRLIVGTAQMVAAAAVGVQAVLARLVRS